LEDHGVLTLGWSLH